MIAPRSFALAATFLPLILSTTAQVRVDKPVVLTGTDAELRQVSGLPVPTAPSHALTASTEQSGAQRTRDSGPGPDWSVEVPLGSDLPPPGTHLVVRTTGTSTGPVSLMVNGTGPWPVVHRPNDPLLGEETTPGGMVSLVFDGSLFHVMNGSVYKPLPCPSGTIPVNGHFCMQPVENSPSATFFDAALFCAGQGLRLCSWAEFVVACELRDSLGINDITGNWEWTRTSAGSNRVVRMVGSQGCTSASTASTNEGAPLRRWRCCASR